MGNIKIESMSNAELVEYYKDDIAKLITYLPWLESKLGQQTSQIYSGNDIGVNSVPFPVYDGSLLRFVKACEETCFMDRNYVYVYTRNRIVSFRDELQLIQKSTIRDMLSLGGILSNYIIGGRRKAALWSEGVRNGVYVSLLRKMKEIMEYWDRERLKDMV